MTERVVPLAYVTKYAEARGIVTVRGARTDETGCYLVAHSMFVRPGDWTEDKAEAERRYVATMKNILKVAERRIARIRAAIAAAPAYEKEKP